MARTSALGVAKRDTFFVQPQIHSAHEALSAKIADLQKAKKIDPKEAQEMLALLADGQTYISYERFERKEEGRGFDESKPLADLKYGAIWIGKPDVEHSTVLMSNRAIRGSGDGGNFNAIVEQVDRGGRTYQNTVGIKFSEWARKQDQAEYEAWAKANKIVLPNSQVKPKGDLPVGAGSKKSDEVPFNS